MSAGYSSFFRFIVNHDWLCENEFSYENSDLQQLSQHQQKEHGTQIWNKEYIPLRAFTCSGDSGGWRGSPRPAAEAWVSLGCGGLGRLAELCAHVGLGGKLAQCLMFWGSTPSPPFEDEGP